MRFGHEGVAGLSTFFTMAYALVLCPQILSAGGLDFGAALTATVLTIAFTTVFLGLFAGYPIVAGPGLSVMTYLVFSVIGTNMATWPQALGLVFWAGLLILILSVTRLRQKILIQIPPALKRAAPAGLGLFFIIIGLKQLDLLRIESTGYFYSIGTIGSLGQGIASLGLILFFILHIRQIRGAFLFPMLFCWILSLLTGSTQWSGEFFSLPPSLFPTWNQLDLSSVLNPELWGPLLAIVLITLFDTGAMLLVLTRLLGWTEPHGSFRNLNRVVIPDGIGTMLGSFLGTTSCAFYAESSSGICAGGRGPIVAYTAALCCLGALFIYPILSSIPQFATAPVLLGLGAILAMDLRQMEWDSPTDWIPFLITALAMPLFFSLYWGFALGFLSFVLLKTLSGRIREVRGIVWVLSALFAIHISSLLLHTL